MNAAEVRDALCRRWPPTQYVVVEEAPEDPMRAGRKIDMLVISCWKSRGYETEAVEIKVSVNDWKREVDNPHKADFWFRHCHRFWVAVPQEIAAKVRETLPVGWGLLSVGVDKVGADKVVVSAAPQRHDAEPLTWPTTIGVLRANQGAGMGAIQRARSQGYDEGRAAGRAQAERERGQSFLQEQLKSLQARVLAFEQVTGVDLVHASGVEGAARAGRLYSLANRAFAHPDDALRDIERALSMLASAGETVKKLRSSVAEALTGEEVPA